MVRESIIQKSVLLIPLLMLIFACSSSRVVTKQDIYGLKQEPELELTLWTDHKGNTYQVGEEIYFFLAANRDCYLTIFSIGSDGKVKILLPNEYQKDNQAKAGYVYRIPSQKAQFRFKTRDPVGENKIIALATLEDITLYDQIDHWVFKMPIKEADVEEELIDKVIRKIDSSKWTKCKMRIKIVNKS